MADKEYDKKYGVQYRCRECGKIWIGDPYIEPICPNPKCRSDNIEKR